MIRATGQCHVTFQDCIFRNNTSPRAGVASIDAQSSVDFFGCLLDSNSAITTGGAVECQSNAFTYIENTTFV